MPEVELNGFAPASPSHRRRHSPARWAAATGRRSSACLGAFEQHADFIPDERMQLAGWILISRLPRSRRPAIRNAAISRAILAAWPNPVRLTIDEIGQIAIWRQSAPPPANGHAPFPSPPDIEQALRVVEAVGMGRESALADEIAFLTADSAASSETRALKLHLDANQTHFEAVADAMRSFGRPSPA
jgi:hypothetical protein